MSLILVILVLLILFGCIPSFPYGYNTSGRWGYYPSGLGLILLIVLILFLLRLI